MLPYTSEGVAWGHRPHHLPKMAAPIQAGLQGKLESIKRSMEDSSGGVAALGFTWQTTWGHQQPLRAQRVRSNNSVVIFFCRI